MELDEAIASRRSVREFSERLVSDEDLRTLMTAASMAPTSCNLQVYKFILVDEPSLLRDLAKRVTGKINWTRQLLVLVVDPRITWENRANYISAGMVVQNLMLKARSMGIATCPIAGFKNKAYLKERLGVPDALDVPLLVFVGFEDASKADRVRIPHRCAPDQLLSRNRYRFGDMFPTSADIDRWDDRLVGEYRSRIMPVYFPRFRHGLWGPAYRAVWERLLDAAPGAVVLCFFPWEPEIFDLARERKLRLVVADILPDYLGFLQERFGDLIVATVDLSADPQSVPACDVATIGGTLQFQRDIERVFRTAARALEGGGEMRLGIFRRNGLLGLAFRLARATGVKGDVYHDAPFYRVGPFGFQRAGALRRSMAQSGFQVAVTTRVATECLASRIAQPLLKRVARIAGRVLPETQLYELRPVRKGQVRS